MKVPSPRPSSSSRPRLHSHPHRGLAHLHLEPRFVVCPQEAGEALLGREFQGSSTQGGVPRRGQCKLWAGMSLGPRDSSPLGGPKHNEESVPGPRARRMGLTSSRLSPSKPSPAPPPLLSSLPPPRFPNSPSHPHFHFPQRAPPASPLPSRKPAGQCAQVSNVAPAYPRATGGLEGTDQSGSWTSKLRFCVIINVNAQTDIILS